MALYLDSVRNVYEAYVIYNFTTLLMLFLESEDEASARLDGGTVKHLVPCCCLRPYPLGKRFFHRTRQGTLQYVIIKPVIAALTCIFELSGVYGEGGFNFKEDAYPWIFALDMTSVSVAMYALIMFYMGTRELLAPFRPVIKFAVIKAVIFLSFWQGALLAFLSYISVVHDGDDFTADQLRSSVQDYLICFEMLGAAIAHHYAFPWREFLSDELPIERVPMARRIRSMLSVSDVVRDTKTMMRPGTAPRHRAASVDDVDVEAPFGSSSGMGPDAILAGHEMMPMAGRSVTRSALEGPSMHAGGGANFHAVNGAGAEPTRRSSGSDETDA